MSVFPIAPAASRYLWILVPVCVLLIGVLIMLAISLRGGRASQFTVSPDSLRLHGDWYGRTLPLSQLRITEARRVDLKADTGLRPSWRRIGTGLPGYSAGWFKLRNGEKALLYLTDQSKAVYVPTTQGYSLLLSPADPDEFLAAIRGSTR
jgi:hypothetical protein